MEILDAHGTLVCIGNTQGIFFFFWRKLETITEMILENVLKNVRNTRKIQETNLGSVWNVSRISVNVWGMFKE